MPKKGKERTLTKQDVRKIGAVVAAVTLKTMQRPREKHRLKRQRVVKDAELVILKLLAMNSQLRVGVLYIDGRVYGVPCFDCPATFLRATRRGKGFGNIRCPRCNRRYTRKELLEHSRSYRITDDLRANLDCVEVAHLT